MLDRCCLLHKNNLVFPGSFLAFEEEFMAGSHAFEDSQGNVFADAIGAKMLDSANHEASVKPFPREVRLLERGNTVIAIVSSVKTNAVLVEILEAWNGAQRRTVHNRMVLTEETIAITVL